MENQLNETEKTVFIEWKKKVEDKNKDVWVALVNWVNTKTHIPTAYGTMIAKYVTNVQSWRNGVFTFLDSDGNILDENTELVYFLEDDAAGHPEKLSIHRLSHLASEINKPDFKYDLSNKYSLVKRVSQMENIVPSAFVHLTVLVTQNYVGEYWKEFDKDIITKVEILLDGLEDGHFNNPLCHATIACALMLLATAQSGQFGKNLERCRKLLSDAYLHALIEYPYPKTGVTLLHATMPNNETAMRQLFDLNNDDTDITDINIVNEKTGKNILFAAVSTVKKDLVNILIESEIDVNQQSKTGVTPLIAAAKKLTTIEKDVTDVDARSFHYNDLLLIIKNISDSNYVNQSLITNNEGHSAFAVVVFGIMNIVVYESAVDIFMRIDDDTLQKLLELEDKSLRTPLILTMVKLYSTQKNESVRIDVS